MNLHIDKESELTAYEQLREQIIFLISTGEIEIGKEMPSVRRLARQLSVSPNTVSKVYSGLVRGGWLVEHPGAHHKVVEWKRRTEPSLSAASLDELIDETINVALGNGYSLQQLTDHLRKRLLDQPPDHLLIVEPDPGMGEILREEIRQTIGYGPPTCTLKLLQQHPALGIGALLITPVYMLEKLGQSAIDGRRAIAVSYSPLDKCIRAISELSQPSMIGLVSVSGAGLKTVSGVAARAISNRHSSHLFLMDRPDPKEAGQFTLRRFRVGDYRPIDILKATEQSASTMTSTAESGIALITETAHVSDLRCMDLLLLDSIASQLIEHPHAVQYKLLSDTSLKMIEVAARTLAE